MEQLPLLQIEEPAGPDPAHRCPSCLSTDVERTARRSFERLLPRLRPYRCWVCGRRFLDRPSTQR
ncbi:MAG TPA: hypothetical protein VMQ51_19635 [Candidatus Binatia bacterium]|nr:hypothetical protein [Candidatus Binatia bacterium]